MNEPASDPFRTERALLGAILIAGRSKMPILSPEDFASDAHRRIWRAMNELDADGHGIDLVTVSHRLEDGHEMQAINGLAWNAGHLLDFSGWAYLAALVDHVPDVDNVESYADAVRSDAIRRRRESYMKGLKTVA